MNPNSYRIGGSQGTTSNPVGAPPPPPPQPAAPLDIGNTAANVGFGAVLAFLQSPQSLSLVGFVVIAATGHLDDWRAWFMYIIFLFLLPLHSLFTGIGNLILELAKSGNWSTGWKKVCIVVGLLLFGSALGATLFIAFPKVPTAAHDYIGELLTKQKKEELPAVQT